MIADPRNMIIVPEVVERTRFSALKIMRGIGPREVLAIIIGFFITIIALPMPMGLTEKVAVVVISFLSLLTAVKFKWRGYTLEQLIYIYIKFARSPRIYINQRSYPVSKVVNIPTLAPAPVEVPLPPQKPDVVAPKAEIKRVPKPSRQPKPKAPSKPRPSLSPVSVWALIGLVFVIALVYTGYIILTSYGII